MEQKLQATKKCNNETDRIAKGFCLSIVHQGINKCISNATFIEIYNTASWGIQDPYEVIEEGVKVLDGKELARPLEVVLNKNNIPAWVKAILDSCKSEKNSLFSFIADSPY